MTGMGPNDVLERKWRTLRARAAYFRSVPFVEFVIVAGSMATGKARETSDFDVILGVRRGRIFLARFFAMLVLGVLGLRKRRGAANDADLLCLSHFVTPDGYCLKPPYNAYWTYLYRSLVPVWGDTDRIDEFFEANNAWLSPPRRYGAREHAANIRFVPGRKTRLVRLFELVLGGRSGDRFEQMAKRDQMERIMRHEAADKGYKPRLIYTDEELEFHPDTRRIDEFVKASESAGNS